MTRVRRRRRTLRGGAMVLPLAFVLAACGFLDEVTEDLLGDESPDVEEEPGEGEAASVEETEDQTGGESDEEAADLLEEPEIEPGAWSPWAMPGGDAGGTYRSSLPGPMQPGLAWQLDLGDVEAAFAPEGYSLATEDLLHSAAGPIVAMVSNEDEQYEDTARFRRELIGIDPADGGVLWEIPNVSPVNSGRCLPALDREDRIWVEQRPGGGDRIVAAFDPATGEPTGHEIEAEDRRCREQLLIGGVEERLVFSSREAQGLRLFDIDGDAPEEITTELAGRDDVGELLNHDQARHWAVMTDTHLVTLVEVVDDDGDPVRHELVAVALEDGTTSDAIELPTPDGTDSAEHDRAALVAARDRVFVSLYDGPAGLILGVDVIDGGLEVAWSYEDLEEDASDLTLADGRLLFQDGSRVAGAAPALQALDVRTGELVFDDGVPTGDRVQANPDGTVFGRTAADGGSRLRAISRLDDDGQLSWYLPWEELARVTDGDPEDPDSFSLTLAGVDEAGTLYATSDGGDGTIVALERGGDLAVELPSDDDADAEDDG